MYEHISEEQMPELGNYVEGRGNYVKQAKPCKDCGEEWGMYEDEIRFYENLQKKDKDFKMPVRCATCRKKKRGGKREEAISLDSVIGRVFKMAKNAGEGSYTLKDKILENELREVGQNLVTFQKGLKASGENQSLPERPQG